MKITRDNDAPTTTTVAGTDVWELTLDAGATEGGSSGGPYFDQNHRIIAQHLGTDDLHLPICDRDTKFGGRFDLSWTGGGTNATRLSTWLDPSNSNAMTTNTTNVSSLVSDVYSISGPDVFCTTGNYSVPGYTGPITWFTASYATINSSGVATKVTDGPAIIQATIYPCSGTQVLTKAVHAGAPIEGWIFTEKDYVGSGAGKVISPMGYTGLGAKYDISGHPAGIGGILEYHWTINDHSNWNILPLNSDASSVELEYWNSPAPFNQKIHIRARNVCGWSPYLETTWTFSSFFAKYSVSPNPASDYVTLLFEDLVDSKGLPELVELMSENSTTPIRSISTTTSNFESVKNNDNKLSIPVSDLPRGTYYLHVSYGGQKKPDKHRVVLK